MKENKNVVVRLSQTTNTGYELVETDGRILTVEISKDDLCLVLPTNSTGRKFVMRHKVDEAGEVELTYRAPRPRGGATANKPLTDFMTDEERATYDAILAKAEVRRAEAVTNERKAKEDKRKDTLIRLQKQVRDIEMRIYGRPVTVFDKDAIKL